MSPRLRRMAAVAILLAFVHPGTTTAQGSPVSLRGSTVVHPRVPMAAKKVCSKKKVNGKKICVKSSDIDISGLHAAWSYFDDTKTVDVRISDTGNPNPVGLRSRVKKPTLKLKLLKFTAFELTGDIGQGATLDELTGAIKQTQKNIVFTDFQFPASTDKPNYDFTADLGAHWEADTPPNGISFAGTALVGASMRTTTGTVTVKLKVPMPVQTVPQVTGGTASYVGSGTGGTVVFRLKRNSDQVNFNIPAATLNIDTSGTPLVGMNCGNTQAGTSKPYAYFLKCLTYPTSSVVEKDVEARYGAPWTDHLPSDVKYVDMETFNSANQLGGIVPIRVDTNPDGYPFLQDNFKVRFNLTPFPTPTCTGTGNPVKADFNAATAWWSPTLKFFQEGNPSFEPATGPIDRTAAFKVGNSQYNIAGQFSSPAGAGSITSFMYQDASGCYNWHGTMVPLA